MEYTWKCKVRYIEKAVAAFNIRLNNHWKGVDNPNSNPVDLYFRKPGYPFNLHTKLTSFEQMSNTHTTNKATLKLPLKHCKDF